MPSIGGVDFVVSFDMLALLLVIILILRKNKKDSNGKDNKK